MRTAEPNNIKTDFLAGLQDILDTFIGISRTALSSASKNLMAEYSFLGASILLEGFISDLFVAYINRKNGPFVSYLTSRMQVQATDEHAKRASSLASIDIASHLKLDQIRQILDPRDYNVTFHTSAVLKSRAAQWLDAPHSGYFISLTSMNCAVMDTIKAVRNYLAHRSGASKTAMQTALLNADLPAELRRGAHKVSMVGSYLDAKPTPTSARRLETYLAQCTAIANRLCP